MSDTRLSASHHRLLAAIASHDRLSLHRGSGQGCWASHKTLAAEATVHETNIPRLAADLEAWGYLEKTRHPLNRKHRVYRLFYNAHRATPGEITSDNLPDVSPPPETPSVPGETTSLRPAIPGEPNHQVSDLIGVQSTKYIPQSGERYSAKAEKDLAKAPASKAAPAEAPMLQWGDIIARVQRLIRLSAQHAGSILALAQPNEYAYLQDPRTPDDRFILMLKAIVRRADAPARNSDNCEPF